MTTLFKNIALFTVVLFTACVADPPEQAELVARPSGDDANPWLKRRVLNIAHRGGALEAPENTLYAFTRALELGADVLEMDVWMTSDGELVVFHDAELDRTTNGGEKSVSGLNLAEVQALDAAYWFVPGEGAVKDRPEEDYVFRGVATGEVAPPPGTVAEDFRVPTLRQVLERYPHARLNIEIKGAAPLDVPYEEKLAKLLGEFGRGDDVIVASFYDQALEAFQLAAAVHCPDVSTALALGRAAAFYAASQHAGPGLPDPRYHALQVPPTEKDSGLEVVTPGFVEDAHARGYAVHVWDAEGEDLQRELIAVGVDGIMTDRPGELQELLCDLQVALDGGRCAYSDVRTFVVVLDGMEPELIGPALTPNLWGLIQGTTGNATTFMAATGSMVAETNANHVGMMTGLPGSEHGVVANRFYRRDKGEVARLEEPSLILRDTLFDAFARQRPGLVTAAILGKEKLRTLFDCTKECDGCGSSSANPEGRTVTHARPTVLGGATTKPGAVLEDPEHEALGEPASGSGVTLDAWVMDQVIRAQQGPAPTFTFVNLAQIDGFQHLFGAKSAEALAAVTNADHQIGRLIAYLRESGKWSRSILIVTADHSFQALDEGTGVAPLPVLSPLVGQFSESRVILKEELEAGSFLEVVSHGGSASIYLKNPDDAEAAGDIAEAALGWKDVHGHPAVAAAYCRIPPADGSCPRIPEDWGLGGERIGEVLLVADDQHVFLERRQDVGSAALAGHHGAPTTLPVPLIVASGGSLVDQRVVDRPVTTRDIAPTVAHIYRLRVGEELFPGAQPWSSPLSEALRRSPGRSFPRRPQ